MDEYTQNAKKIKILVRIRGHASNKSTETLETEYNQIPGKGMATPKDVRSNTFTSTSKSRSRSKSPQFLGKNTTPVIKPTGLDENLKYSIFTAIAPSNTVVVTNKPITGKLINSTFRTTSDLYEFSRSILKDTVLLEFDRVYNESHKLDTIYNEQLKESVNNLFIGKNACCILFGPTEGGKSYTLRGANDSSNSEHGILFKAITDIFNLVDLSKQSNIGEKKSISKVACGNVQANSNQGQGAYFAVKMSIYQVYCDQINDLLSKDYARNIKIEKYFDKDNNLCTQLVDLTEKEIRNKKDYDNCLREAVHFRKALAQALKVNELKRKSNLVISIILEWRERTIEGINKTNERAIENYAQFDFVELASSNFGLLNNETKMDDLLYRSTSKTFNSMCNNIVCASAGITPKNESKLTLALKNTLRPENQLYFISCVTPWENPPGHSYKALKFSNWLRNQIFNLQANKDYQIKSTYEDSDHEEIDNQVDKNHNENNTSHISHKKGYLEDDKLNNNLQIEKKKLPNMNPYYSNSSNEKEEQHADLCNNGDYSSNEENEIRKIREKIKKKYPYMDISDDEKKDKAKADVPSMSMGNKIKSSHPNSMMNIHKEVEIEDVNSKEKKLKDVERSLKDLEAKSLEVSRYLESMRQERSRIDDSRYATIKPNVSAQYNLNSNFDFDYEKIKQEHATLKSDNIIFREDINRLTDLNLHLEEELQKQRNRNLELAAENEMLVQEKNKMRMDIDKLNENVSKVKVQEHNMMEVYNQRMIYENKIRDMESELKKLRDEKQNYEVDFRVLQERHLEMKKNYENCESELNFIKTKHGEEVEKIEEKLDKMTEEIEFLQRENSSLRVNDERLRQEISTMEKQRENYREKYQDHKQKNNLLNVKLGEIENEFRTLMKEKQNEEFEKKKDDESKKIKIDSKQKIVGELQSRIANYRTEILRQRNKKEDN